MSKNTQELFKLWKQSQEIEEAMTKLKEKILKEEILDKGKTCLQDRFVTVGYNRGTSSSVSIDQKVFAIAEKELYNSLVEKYPKYSKGKDSYYTWSFAKDK